jgi:hypothetical protein
MNGLLKCPAQSVAKEANTKGVMVKPKPAYDEAVKAMIAALATGGISVKYIWSLPVIGPVVKSTTIGSVSG